MSIELSSLAGTNPVGFLAALGVLGAAERTCPDSRVTLSWSKGIVPHPVLGGFDSVAEMVDVVDEDRIAWSDSLVLYSGPAGEQLDEIKPRPGELHSWAELILGSLEGPQPAQRRDADLLCSLLAEGAAAGSGDAKPTHLHFTAGQQKFLAVARELSESADHDVLEAVIAQPWKYESKLKGLNWDCRGERIYALSGTNPSKEKRGIEAGAEWLSLLGLMFVSVACSDRDWGDPLLTAGFSGSWKTGRFAWPLWSCPIPAQVVRSLLSSDMSSVPASRRVQRGVFRVIDAPVRRSAQGGYGSFGPAADLPNIDRSNGGNGRDDASHV